MNLEQLVVDLRLNAEEFSRGLESAMTQWESFGGSLMKIGAGLSAALTVPIVGLGQAAIKMGTQLQQAEIAFGTMLGSAELAGAYLEELKEFAAKTPFEFSELVPAAKRLMALGFAAEETIPMLKALGNAAAGLGGGAPLIQRLGLALGQMRAKAKVSAEEMRQLAEAGIPAWEMLAKAMGKTTGELMKLSEKGQVSAAAAIPLLIAGINEKFGGLMEGFMETAMGQYSNVKDQLGFVLADIGKALLPIAAMLIEKFALPAVSALRDLAAWFSKLDESTKTTIIAFAALAAAIGPVTLALGGMGYMYAPLIAGAARVAGVLIPMFSNIALAVQTNMVGALTLAEKQLLGFVGVAGPALLALGAAFVLWQIPVFQEAVKGLWDQVQKFWTGTVKPFADAMLNVGEAFLKAAGDLAASGLAASLEFLKSVMTSESVKEFGKSLTDLSAAVKDLVAAFQPLRDVLEPVVSFFGQWAAIAVGGQITLALEALKLALYTSTELLKAFTEIAGAQLKYGLDVGKQGVDNLVSTLGFLTPVMDKTLAAFTGFIDWVKKEFPIIAVIAGYVGEAYDKLKAKTESWVKSVTSSHKTATAATSSALDQMTANFKASEEVYSKAVKALSEFDKATGKAMGTQEAAAGADVKMQQAKAALVAQMEKEGVGIKTLYDATIKSQSAYSAATVAMEQLKAAHGQGAAAAKALADAQAKVGQAHQDVVKAQIALTQSGSRLGLTLADIKKQYDKVIPAAKTLEDGEKALKEAVKAATIQLDIAMRTQKDSLDLYDGSEESITRLATATGVQRKELEKAKTAYDRVNTAVRNLQAAENALKPEKVAERRAKANEEMAKHVADMDKWAKEWSTTQERIDKADKDIETSLVHTAMVFGKALQQMRAEASQEIEITTPIQKRLPTIINETLKRQADLQGAYKATGAVSIAALKQQVAESKQAYDTISADAAKGAGERMSSEYEVLQVTRAYYTDLLALERATNGSRVKDYEKAIDKMDERLKKFGEKQKSFWSELGQAIQGIMMNWAADIGRGMWDVMLGKQRREFNKGLDQQASDLNASLAERTQEWEDYQNEIAARQTEARQEYETTLAEESAALQVSLDERVQDYADAEAETAQKLGEVRAEYAKDLADQLADLAESLAERRLEYEDYVQEVADRLAETRSTHAEQLAEQLSDLRDSLDDQRRSYGEYVDDVNKKLRRVGEDYTESLDDQTKSVSANIAERKKDYTRDEDDILEKIARLKKAGKKENSEEIQDLRKQLRRKKEDLDQYVGEQTAALTEYKDDAKRNLDRETADLKESLKERADDWTRYQEDNQAKRNEYISKNAQDLAKEEADLAHSLADRTADWVKYQADNAKSVDAAYTKYTEGLAKEEKSLLDSLAKKAAALDAYILEVNKKWEKIQAAALAKLNQEETDLAASLVTRGTEYDKYVAGIQIKLDELVAMHKSAWDEIGGMVVGAFEKAGESVMTFITTYLMDALLNSFKKGKLVDAIKDFGGWLKGIFTGADGTGEGPSGFGLPGGISQGIGAGTGEAGGLAGAVGSAASAGATGAMGMVNMISGIATAAASIVSLFQNYGMGKDMEQSAQTLIKIEHITRDTLVTANLYWPKLKDIHDWTVGPQFEILKEINDSIVSMHLMQGPNFANIIDRLDTLVLSTLIPLAAGASVNPLSPNVTGVAGVAISSSVTVQGNVIGNRAYLDEMSNALAGRLRLQGATL